jgi:hypothetical protein
MDHHGQEQAGRVDQDVPLATADLLAAVVATRPPFSVVFTDWLSRIAPLGSGSRPALIRTSSRKAELIAAQVPSRLHIRK